MSRDLPRLRLPVDPSAEHLRKQAKRRAALAAIPLARAQHQLARDYGCTDWGDLMRTVASMQRRNEQQSDGAAPLAALPDAANRNDLAQVRTLLAAGQCTRHDLDLALARAVLRFGQRQAIAELLIAHGADPDGQYGAAYGPIVLAACECLDPDGLAFLLRHGADVTFAPMATTYGAASPLIAVLGTYVRSAQARRHRCIDLLLAHGAQMPAGVTPEMLAIFRGDADTLAAALARADDLVDRRFPDLPFGNLRLAGGTLLHLAVELGELACIDLLLRHGADLNARALVQDGYGGQTPLWHAVATNQNAGVPVLEHLILRSGRWIDRDATARVVVHGKPIPQAMTLAQYADWTIDGAPADWPRATPRERELLRSLERPRIDDPDFAAAVAAIDAGDGAALGALLARAPHLATARADEAGAYAGPYFAQPGLLCFVAENPVRTGRMASNVAALAACIIAAGAPRADLDRTLALVCSGAVARRSGQQRALLELLLAHGADPSAGLHAAIQHGDVAAAQALIAAGASHDLASAAALGDRPALRRLLAAGAPSAAASRAALRAAALHGQAESISILITVGGIAVDLRVHQGSTALHHAAAAGHVHVVEQLLALGAGPERRDGSHHGRPAEWAAHGGHHALAERLRTATPMRPPSPA